MSDTPAKPLTREEIVRIALMVTVAVHEAAKEACPGNDEYEHLLVTENVDSMNSGILVREVLADAERVYNEVIAAGITALVNESK